MNGTREPLRFGVLSDLHVTDPALGPCRQAELFRTVARSRDLTPEDIVRNAREIEARHTLTIIGGGGLPNLPM